MANESPWYSVIYGQLARVAQRYGYCLAVHGSMHRDLDLVAIPWVENAAPADRLIKAFERFVREPGTKPAKGKHLPTKKPHGRLAYAIHIGYDHHYLDVSVMPRKQDWGKKVEAI